MQVHSKFDRACVVLCGLWRIRSQKTEGAAGRVMRSRASAQNGSVCCDLGLSDAMRGGSGWIYGACVCHVACCRPSAWYTPGTGHTSRPRR